MRDKGSADILANALGYAAVLFLQTYAIHVEKSFGNLIKSTRNQIVFTMHRLIWIQTTVRLDPNQSENGKYNLISV